MSANPEDAIFELPQARNEESWVSVVGESHYQDALDRHCGGRVDGGHRVEAAFALIPEPTNQHDPHAVKVCIGRSGATVGYLPRELARKYQPALLRLALVDRFGVCWGVISGGWVGRREADGYYGVRLNLASAKKCASAVDMAFPGAPEAPRPRRAPPRSRQRPQSAGCASVLLGALTLVPILGLSGCFSPADLRAQAPVFSRVYEGNPDAFASCLLSEDRSGYFLAPAIARRSDVYLPGELVEIEYGNTDMLHLADHVTSSFTARRVADGAIRVEFRRREGLFTQEITPDQAFAPVEPCLGPRRADLE